MVMNLLSIASREITRKKGRAFLTALVIAISVGAFVASNGLVDSLGTNYIDLVIEQFGDIDCHVRVNVDPTHSLTFSQTRPNIENASALSDEIETVEGVSGTVPRFEVSTSEILLPTNKTILLPFIAIDTEQEEELEIGSLDYIGEQEVKPGLNECLVLGTVGQSLLEINEVILVSWVDAESKLHTLNLTVKGYAYNNKKFPSRLDESLLINIDSIYQFFPDSANYVVVQFKNRDQMYSVKDVEGSVDRALAIGRGIQEKIGFDYDIQLSLSNAIAVGDFLFTFLRVFLNFISLLILLIAAVLIYSLYTTAVEQKVYEYAVMRVVGAKESFLKKLVLLEGSITSLIGSLLGIPLGAALLNFLVALVEAIASGGVRARVNNVSIQTSTFSISAYLAPETALMGLLIGIGTGLIAAFLPALRAGGRNIISALDVNRETAPEETEITSRLEQTGRLFLPLGLALTGAGGLIFISTPVLNASGDLSLFAGFLLMLLFLTLIGLVLIIVGGAGPFGERLALRVMGIFSTAIAPLTKAFLLRNKRRNIITMLMFALAMSFVFFVSVTQDLDQASSLSTLELDYGSDLVVYDLLSTDIISLNHTFLENLTKSYDITASSYSTTALQSASPGTVVTVGDLSLYWKYKGVGIYCLPENFSDALYLNSLEVTNQKQDFWEDMKENNTIVVSQAFSAATRLGVGDKIRVDLGRRETPFSPEVHNVSQLEIVGILNKLPGFSGVKAQERFAGSAPMFVGASTWSTLTNGSDPKEHIRSFYIQLKDNKNMEEEQDIKDELYFQYGTGISILSMNTRRETLLSNQFGTQAILIVITWIAVAITLISVFANTQTSVIESRSRIGVLKAIGLKDRQIRRVFVLESLVVTSVSCFLGALVGIGLAYWNFFNQVISDEVPLPIIFPGELLVINIILVCILSMISAYIPVRQISKLSAAEILRA